MLNGRRSKLVVAATAGLSAVTAAIILALMLNEQFVIEPTTADVVGNPIPAAATFELLSPTDEVPPETEDSTHEVSQQRSSRPTLPAPTPIRVVVLPTRFEHDHAETRALTEAVRDVALVTLSNSTRVQELRVLSESDLVPPLPSRSGLLGRDNLAHLALINRYGDVTVAEFISERPDMVMLRYRSRNNVRGGKIAYFGLGFPDMIGDPSRIGKELAEDLLQFAVRVPVQSSHLLIPSDASTDDERVSALRALGIEGFDSGAREMALSIGIQSESAEARGAVWAMLRDRVYDPALVETMSYALLSDPDPAVRREAAISLSAYSDVPGASAALGFASGSDDSSEVRLVAQLAMMDSDQIETFRRETLLDESLSHEERFAPMLVRALGVGRFRDSNGPGVPRLQESAAALIEIASTRADAEMRDQVLRELTFLLRESINSNQNPADLVGVLTNAYAEGNDDVRQIAATHLYDLLNGFKGPDRIQAAYREDPTLAERYRLEDLLNGDWVAP